MKSAGAKESIAFKQLFNLTQKGSENFARSQFFEFKIALSFDVLNTFNPAH